MRIVPGLVAMAAMTAAAPATAIERFSCAMTPAVTVGIDADNEVMTIGDANRPEKPICEQFAAMIAPDNPNRAVMLASKGQCRTSIDQKLAIADWPVRASNTADMTIFAIFDRVTRQFTIYGRRSRDNFVTTGKCTAL